MLPSDIFEVTTRIYTLFDEIAKQYPISMIHSADNLMVGCLGLFNDNVDPNEQARFAIKFALALNQSIDDVNIQLSTDLHFSIIVHAGGPAIGALLNTNTPVFAIECQAMNEAIFLCQQYGKSTAIFMTQAVADKIEQNNHYMTIVGPTKVTNLHGENENILEIDRP